ncbi:helix-turn-helix domain-containing protein [Rhodoplanes roseus]|uniref:Chromosomal replication initiator protein DnaA n=1 Tax=Rhodoplanes roseus TaxID=29409 RepID=A0A327KZ88_9BRAD|nr:DnaA/Hda family protein [Rhodoplanes roseus]RAI42935.1 hypothetical protein CH341_17015 [Rhodoplanes roseus]
MTIQPMPTEVPRLAPSATRDLACCWARAREHLLGAVGRDAFESFLTTLHLDHVDAGTAQLSVATRFLRIWIERHYAAALRDALRSAGVTAERIAIAVRSVGVHRTPAVSPCGAAPPAARVEDRTDDPDRVAAETAAGVRSALDPRLTFETFALGAANQAAHAAALAVIEGTGFDLLAIHGETGLGKTHLLQAIASRHGDALYLTAEQLRFGFDQALRRDAATVWRSALISAPLLLLDDLHVLVRIGHALPASLLHVLDRRAALGRVTAAAIDRPTRELEGEQRLLSRLAGALGVGLEPPDASLRRAIVIMKLAAIAERHSGFVLPSEVIDLVAGALRRGPRDLEGALARLVLHQAVAGTPPDRAAAERVIGEMAGALRPPVRIDIIQQVVARRYGVTVTDMRSARRTAAVLRPRQMAMWLTRTMTPKSLPEIGRRFGGRDHTTVLHAVEKYERLRRDDPGVQAELDALAEAIEQEVL